jgi:hypothetical protein
MPSGLEDAWAPPDAYDGLLSGDVVGIPAVDGVNQWGPVTGWNGPAGWRAFLEDARRGGVFQFYPDRDAPDFFLAHLVEPMRGAPTEAPALTRGLPFVIRTADGTTPAGY